jgi:hypothetical protein
MRGTFAVGLSLSGQLQISPSPDVLVVDKAALSRIYENVRAPNPALCEATNIVNLNYYIRRRQSTVYCTLDPGSQRIVDKCQTITCKAFTIIVS